MSLRTHLHFNYVHIHYIINVGNNRKVTVIFCILVMFYSSYVFVDDKRYKQWIARPLLESKYYSHLYGVECVIKLALSDDQQDMQRI